MSVRKLSVSLPEEVANAVAAAAEIEGVGLSAWLATAARERLRAQRAIDIGYQAARELIVEYTAEHGPIPAEAHEWAESVLAEAGLGAGRREERAAG